jgi:predicted nucleotidyltransferase
MIEAPPNPWQTEDSYRHLCGTFPALRDWSCLEVWRGSIAHGTYVPNDDPLSIDDKDLIGICIPPAEYYVGLRQFGSRGTEEIQSDPWDVVVYEHRKALRLLAKGNPNMLCMLWAPPEFTTYYTAAGEALLACTDKDVIERAATLLEVNLRGPYQQKNHHKEYWTFRLAARDDVLAWCHRLRPLMGVRRQEQIDTVIAADKEYPRRRTGVHTGRKNAWQSS